VVDRRKREAEVRAETAETLQDIARLGHKASIGSPALAVGK
jgi:hypothetical protein